MATEKTGDMSPNTPSSVPTEKPEKPARQEKQAKALPAVPAKPRKPESVDGRPVSTDSQGHVHVGARFFDAPHVPVDGGGTVEVRRAGDKSYIHLEGPAVVRLRTGVKIFSNILDWRGLPAIPGEVLVTDISVENEEVIILARAFGGLPATLNDNDPLVELTLE